MAKLIQSGRYAYIATTQQKLVIPVLKQLHRSTHRRRATLARAQKTAVRPPPGLQTLPWNGTPEEEQARVPLSSLNDCSRGLVLQLWHDLFGTPCTRICLLDERLARQTRLQKLIERFCCHRHCSSSANKWQNVRQASRMWQLNSGSFGTGTLPNIQFIKDSPDPYLSQTHAIT